MDDDFTKALAADYAAILAAGPEWHIAFKRFTLEGLVKVSGSTGDAGG